MKRHLLKIIVGGFIVFLTLPVIFDTDDAESAVSAKAVSAAQEQADDAMLPVVQQALPFRSENVLSKYAGRFKRFYVNSKEEKQKISQEIQMAQNDSVYASADMGGGVRSSYGIAASPEDEAYVKEYFTDAEAKDAPVNYGAVPAAAGTKQKVHDNVPVKGLYESSAVDSYEARLKAKEVYANAMSRVDTTTSADVEQIEPAARPATGKRAVYVSNSDVQDGINNSVRTESKYIGIASKGSGLSSSSGGRVSGGFSSGGISAKEAAASGGINMGNFEVAAENLEGKVVQVAPEGGVSKNFTVVSNGQAGGQKPSNPANPNQPQKPGTNPNNPNNPANPNNPGNPNNPDNPGNPGGNDPQPKPNTFDPSKWVAEYNLSCTADYLEQGKADGPNLLEKMKIAPLASVNNTEKSEVNADKAEETTDIQADKKTEPKKEANNNQPNWSVPCSGLPQLPPAIADKYEFLIIAGVKDGKYVAAANTSFEGTLLRESGGKYAELPVEKDKDGYYYIPEHFLTHKLLKDKNIIPVVSEGEDVKGVYIKPGSLKEDRSAYDKMISDIEKYSKEQAEAAEAAKKAAKEAEAQKAAKAAADSEKKKKDLSEGTKQDIEKVNGK